MEEWADLAGDDGGGYSFRDMPAGTFLTPQYLAAPYVFELNDEATNAFNEYIDKVNGKAGPEYEPGGDEIAGAYWRKSTDKVLQLAGRLRLKGANNVLKEYLRNLTDRGEVFGNLKDGFFPAFDDADE